MTYSIKPLSSFPEHLFRMMQAYQHLSAPRKVEFVTPSKAAATHQRWRLNEFRAAVRREGALALFPDFDRAVLQIRPEPTATNPNAWKIIMSDPEASCDAGLIALADQLAKMTGSTQSALEAKMQAMNQVAQTPVNSYQPSSNNPDDIYNELFAPLSTEKNKTPPQSGG